MAAKSKNRVLKTQNKLLEFDKIQLRDVICSICQSILLEPVTLPCFHNFCQSCFTSSIENNALCCPLCRLRIGSWLRTTTKQKKIVNVQLWDFIKSKFSNEVNTKLQGEDINLSQEQTTICISEPGEIRAEYEAEVKRLQTERLQMEEKQFKETTLLIKKLQKEEDDSRKKYLGILKQDEMLAKKVQEEHHKKTGPTSRRPYNRNLAPAKHRLKPGKIDSYLTKQSTNYKTNPLLIDDSTNSSNGSDSAIPPVKPENRGSPEMVPSYGKFLKNMLDKKYRNISGFWNKENGENCKTKKTDLPQSNNAFATEEKDVDDKSTPTQSLPVSLPYTGILQHKINTLDKQSVGSGSVDSMRQELCYFKPVQGRTTTSYNAKRGLPLRVPVVRLEKPEALVEKESPTRTQYVEGLCLLRNRSLAANLPSAFVVVGKKLIITKTPTETNCKVKQCETPNTSMAAVTRRNTTKSKTSTQVDGIQKLSEEKTLRRTRSMGSISKCENETTPKKAKTKVRQVASERKPYLRSESKKLNAKKELNSPPINSDSVNNNKVNLAVKNLSSPLENCDVEKIFEEQLRIMKQMEQEKKDFELARKVDAELNGRMKLRRPAVKRQASLAYALRPAKKLKV